MAVQDQIATRNMLHRLKTQPLQVLANNDLWVNALPQVADGTPHFLWFAYRNAGIVIDMSNAAAFVGGTQDHQVQERMRVTTMRGYGLPVGAGAGNRHVATQVVQPGSDLWVTELQNGCSVLVLDWGGNRYSMIHLQPSDDTQFNWLGQQLMGLHGVTLAGYKNLWLKRELTRIVDNTGQTPNRYILVQSMFDASSGFVDHVLGVRQGGAYNFYRQKSGGGQNPTAQALTWSTWRWYLPYFSY